MGGIFKKDNLGFGVVRDICAGIRAICGVQTNRKIVTEDTTVEGDGPLNRVEPDDIDGSVLGDAQSNK